MRFSVHPWDAQNRLFRTADVVGLDTLGSVATHLYNALVDDPQRDAFKLPGFLADLIEKGASGE